MFSGHNYINHLPAIIWPVSLTTLTNHPLHRYYYNIILIIDDGNHVMIDRSFMEAAYKDTAHVLPTKYVNENTK